MGKDSNRSARRDLLLQRKEQVKESEIKRESSPQRDLSLQGEGYPADAVQDDYSRREFLKTASVTAATAAVAVSSAHLLAAQAQGANRHDMIAALGDTLIPSDPGDPGYKDLEPYKITEEALKALPGVSDADLELFNERAKEKFGGKTFLELGEPQRAQYLRQITDGTAASDARELRTLQRVYRNTRRRVLTLYYSNFPEHEWPQDEKTGIPVLKPGDLHQLTNPNTKQVFTGWDRVGYTGPLSWEEEERRRNVAKKMHWHENWSPFDYEPELL